MHIATPQEQAESVKVQLWTVERAFSRPGVKAFSGLESIIGLTKLTENEKQDFTFASADVNQPDRLLHRLDS